MRKFHVNVNGTPYEVEVEEIAAGAAPAAPVQAAAPAPALPGNRHPAAPSCSLLSYFLLVIAFDNYHG